MLGTKISAENTLEASIHFTDSLYLIPKDQPITKFANVYIYNIIDHLQVPTLGSHSNIIPELSGNF